MNAVASPSRSGYTSGVGRLLLLLVVACGGKIDSPGSGVTPDAGTDSNDPLGGGGHLLSGKCHFTSSFQPNGDKWIWLTDTDAVATAARPDGKQFTTLCAGRGNESFYYELSTSAVPVAVGDYQNMGQLNQVSNGREAEVTDWGPCAFSVTALRFQDGHQVATGTFDCESLKTLTGRFLMKGTFDVPLP